MALFDALKRKKTDTSDAPKKRTKISKPVLPKKTVVVSGGKNTEGGVERLSHVIIRPHITEKGSTNMGKNAYAFEVSDRANKILVKKAIQELYGKNPVKIHIINKKPKQKMARGRLGKTSSLKKAIVFLKNGDTIEFI